MTPPKGLREHRNPHLSFARHIDLGRLGRPFFVWPAGTQIDHLRPGIHTGGQWVRCLDDPTLG